MFCEANPPRRRSVVGQVGIALHLSRWGFLAVHLALHKSPSVIPHRSRNGRRLVQILAGRPMFSRSNRSVQEEDAENSQE